MNLKQLETATDEKANNLAHVQALINALGNPSEWIYTGVMNDCGAPVSKCACGHPIRYEFMIEHPTTGKKNVLGSTCIEHYAAYNPESADRMKKDYEKHMDELAAKKKEQKEKQQSEEVQKIKAEFDSLREQFNTYLNSKREPGRYGNAGTWLPYQYYGYKRHVDDSEKKIPNYSRKSTMIKKYQELINFINQIIGKSII